MCSHINLKLAHHLVRFASRMDREGGGYSHEEVMAEEDVEAGGAEEESSPADDRHHPRAAQRGVRVSCDKGKISFFSMTVEFFKYSILNCMQDEADSPTKPYREVSMLNEEQVRG